MDCKFPLFKVPIISPDMMQEETIIQIANTLDHLQKVTDIVFQTIDNRIRENKKRITLLHDRARLAKEKVDKLTGRTKATQVFSMAKYPACDVNKDYESIFTGVEKLKFAPNFRKVPSKPACIEKHSLEEKLQFYHVKSGTSTLKDKLNITHEEGLGNLPSNLETVSSLLLFNTSENPYKKYVTLDPMGVTGKMKKNVNTEQTSQMEAAPLSISQQQKFETQTKESYFYSPSLGDVPNLDVPADLPDLPGIADDLKYSSDLGPGFAPSVTTTPAIPELPLIPDDTFQDIGSANEKMDVDDNKAVLPGSKTESASLRSTTPPPPPPPPPPPLPPVPPPPPHEEVSAGDTVGANETKTPEKRAIMETDNIRANLMAAIRDAGGLAKLKSVQGNRDDFKRKRQVKDTSGGGDLMADLHNKLLMRRKGISGREDNVSTVSTMDKISAMIPSPVQQDTSSATEDDDWDE